jgi:hypothetical protein
MPGELGGSLIGLGPERETAVPRDEAVQDQNPVELPQPGLGPSELTQPKLNRPGLDPPGLDPPGLDPPGLDTSGSAVAGLTGPRSVRAGRPQVDRGWTALLGRTTREWPGPAG